MSEYQICKRCVMDTSAVNINFDTSGNCNYCNNFVDNIGKYHSLTDTELTIKRAAFIENIKEDGKNKPYDCILGLSGGVDSSYALYLVKQNGLRPLAVHLDNGWDSELAVTNIKNLVNKLNVDLYTYVIDWEENRDLQRAFFAANVLDIELLMDNAMLALNYGQAEKYKLKYILSGANSSTEGMSIPSNWNHFKLDKKNILSIHRKFGKLRIKSHPLFSSFDKIWNEPIKRRRWYKFLDYFHYDKSEALDILIKEFDYKPYPYKHYESIFTRFYQGYILPEKFKVDKRRVHFSSLIITGQMTRDNALKLLKEDPYPDLEQKRLDREMVIEKLGFTEESFDKYISSPAVSHYVYGSEKWIMDIFEALNNFRKRFSRKK